MADEVTLGWIAEKVNNDMPGFADEPAMTIDGHAGDILSLETEAMEKGDSEGPEAALSWLQSRPGMDSPVAAGYSVYSWHEWPSSTGATNWHCTCSVNSLAVRRS